MIRKWRKTLSYCLKCLNVTWILNIRRANVCNLIYRPVSVAFRRALRRLVSVMPSLNCVDEDMNCDPDKKCFDYLLGPTKDIAQRDRTFYSLCTMCEATKQGSKHSDKTETHAQDKCCELFVPKTDIPKVMFQQTYRQWKAGQDLNWRIRLMRKKRLIVVQPLDLFPEFIQDFQLTFNGQQCIGFFSFLKAYLEVFFFGFDFELRSPVTMESLGWNITTRWEISH